jgi:two-component sensor histidine kinase
LIINELVTNAFKHAFPGTTGERGDERREGEDEIRVGFGVEGDEYVLRVSDNGIGLPFELDWSKSKSLGLHLVNMWAEHQLKGSIEVGEQVYTGDGGRKGTAFTIEFPKRD